MRFTPITLSAVLVIALCGAAPPDDEPSKAAPASAFDAAFEPAAPPASESSSAIPQGAVPAEPSQDAVPAEPSQDAAPTEPPQDAALAEPAQDAVPPEPSLESAVPQTSEAPSPAAENSPPPEPTVPAPSADAVVPAAKPAVPAKGKPPTREYFVGVWAEQGKSCDTALDFKADGTLIGPFPRWELSDTGELTMVGNRQKIFLTVIDANTIQSRRAPTDPPRTLKRCGD